MPAKRRSAWIGPLAVLLAALLPVSAARPELPAPAKASLALPGPPVDLIPADVDEDGRIDLAVILVYNEYDEIEFEQAEGFVHITEIVPALFERREARVYTREPDGSWRLAGDPLPLAASVISMTAGPPGLPLIALTDDGVSAVRLRARGSAPAGAELVLEPLIFEPPAMRGAGAYVPGLQLAQEMDGDGVVDLLLPSMDGPSVHRLGAAGPSPAPAGRLRLPGEAGGVDGYAWRRYPMPQIEDADGDGLPDLIVYNRETGRGGEGAGRRSRSDSRWIDILRGTGGGRFAPPIRIDLACLDGPEGAAGDRELAHFGDVDGSGRAELVTRSEMQVEGQGDFDEAREPHMRYAFHRLNGDLKPEWPPYRQVEVVGYGFGGDWPQASQTELRDLDGDGRSDLITVTLDFSVAQILRAVATKKFGVGLEFHIWAQDGSGGFREAPNRRLTDKMLLDLNDLSFSGLGHFSGDFDGDGAIDFVDLKGGRRLAIRRGGPGGVYSATPDLVIDVGEAPRDPRLVRVLDLNRDGLADLAITRLMPAEEPGATEPAVLDLYLSRAPQ